MTLSAIAEWNLLLGWHSCVALQTENGFVYTWDKRVLLLLILFSKRVDCVLLGIEILFKWYSLK